MNGQIGFITYGTDRPLIGITRYAQELSSALKERQVPLTTLHAGRTGLSNEQLQLWGSARAPGLLTLGQGEIAWHAWRHDLDLIHDPTGTIPLFMTRAKRVATIHDAIPYIYPDASTKLTWLLYHFWLPIAVRRLDEVITVSEQSKADLVHYLRLQPSRVTVIPEGVDRRYRPAGRDQTCAVLQRMGINFPYILYVSAVEPRKKRKNLPKLLEAYAQLRSWSNRWRLVVVGAVHRNYRPVFEVLGRLRLESHVHFTDFVAEEDLPFLYSGADLFVLPSLYEGFGLPVLEAMACGTPVITSDTSALPEVAGDAAILIDPRDTEAITEAMKNVLSNPHLAAEMRAKGLARAGQFSWDRTARETIAVYERVLGRKIT